MINTDFPRKPVQKIQTPSGVHELCLSVVIATNGKRIELLSKVIDCLMNCGLKDKPYYRGLWLVENGQRGGGQELLKSQSAELLANYIFSEQPNKSIACNIALDKVPEGLVLFLDDDVVFDGDLIAIYYSAALNSHFHGGLIFGGPVMPSYAVKPPEWLVPYMPPSARGWHLAANESLGDRTFMGGNWAAYKNDLIKAGLFDPNYGPGSVTGTLGDETEMQLRLRKIGCKSVYLPQARVVHHVPVDRASPSWVIDREYRRTTTKCQLEGQFFLKRSLLVTKLILRHLLRWRYAISPAASGYAKFKADRNRAIIRALHEGLFKKP